MKKWYVKEGDPLPKADKVCLFRVNLKSKKPTAEDDIWYYLGWDSPWTLEKDRAWIFSREYWHKQLECVYKMYWQQIYHDEWDYGKNINWVTLCEVKV